MLSQRVKGSHLCSSPWRLTTSYSFWSHCNICPVFLFNFGSSKKVNCLSVHFPPFTFVLCVCVFAPGYRWWQRSCTTLILMMIYNTIYVFRGKTGKYLHHLPPPSFFLLFHISNLPKNQKQNNADDKNRAVITDCWYEICTFWSLTQTTIHRVVLFYLFVLVWRWLLYLAGNMFFSPIFHFFNFSRLMLRKTKKYKLLVSATHLPPPSLPLLPVRWRISTHLIRLITVPFCKLLDALTWHKNSS